MKKVLAVACCLMFVSSMTFAMGGRGVGGDKCNTMQWKCGAGAFGECSQKDEFKEPVLDSNGKIRYYTLKEGVFGSPGWNACIEVERELCLSKEGC